MARLAERGVGAERGRDGMPECAGAALDDSGPPGCREPTGATAGAPEHTASEPRRRFRQPHRKAPEGELMARTEATPKIAEKPGAPIPPRAVGRWSGYRHLLWVRLLELKRE